VTPGEAAPQCTVASACAAGDACIDALCVGS
jgi:hypothetical protein